MKLLIPAWADNGHPLVLAYLYNIDGDRYHPTLPDDQAPMHVALRSQNELNTFISQHIHSAHRMVFTDVGDVEIATIYEGQLISYSQNVGKYETFACPNRWDPVSQEFIPIKPDEIFFTPQMLALGAHILTGFIESEYSVEADQVWCQHGLNQEKGNNGYLGLYSYLSSLGSLVLGHYQQVLKLASEDPSGLDRFDGLFEQEVCWELGNFIATRMAQEQNPIVHEQLINWIDELVADFFELDN